MYVSKLHNLEIMDKFLETSSLPRLNQEEIENLNPSFTTKEFESVHKSLRKQQNHIASKMNFNKLIKKN